MRQHVGHPNAAPPAVDGSTPPAAAPRTWDRRNFLKTAVAATGVLAMPGALAACSSGSSKTTATVNGQKKALDQFDFSLPIPVEDSGHAMWFVNKMIYGPQEGIDLRMHSADTASDFIRRVASGDYQAAHPSPFLLATLRDQGLPVKFYFGEMATNIFGFAVRPDSPVQTIGDLAGKKIAALATGEDVIWNPGLAAAHVDPSGVRYVVVGLGGARLNAVQNRTTDAMVSWDSDFTTQTFSAKLANQPAPRYLSQEPYFKTPSNGWAAADRALTDPKQRALLVRAARAQAKAVLFTRTNPAAAAQIFHHYFPTVHTAPGQAEAICTAYNNSAFTSGPDGTENRGLGYNSDTRWQTQLQSMRDNKLLKTALQPADLFTNDLVAEINSFDKNEVIQFARSYVFKPPS